MKADIEANKFVGRFAGGHGIDNRGLDIDYNADTEWSETVELGGLYSYSKPNSIGGILILPSDMLDVGNDSKVSVSEEGMISVYNNNLYYQLRYKPGHEPPKKLPELKKYVWTPGKTVRRDDALLDMAENKIFEISLDKRSWKPLIVDRSKVFISEETDGIHVPLRYFRDRGITAKWGMKEPFIAFKDSLDFRPLFYLRLLSYRETVIW